MNKDFPVPALRLLDGRPALVWSCARPWLAVSSAPHGGGLGRREWVVNTMVDHQYARADPVEHIAEMRSRLGLSERGVGMLTAVDVRDVVTTWDSDVRASVTTGVRDPIWAAVPVAAGLSAHVGTINAVCWSPVRLSEAALVNTVATVAEAKAQALLESGVDGTGTVTDATTVLCPLDGPAEPYGGPRSTIGSALARAVHGSVRDGLRVDRRKRD